MSSKNEIIKSKTLADSQKGKEPSQKLMKALKLGDTKVKDGVLYVVKQTPSGSLDWRIANPKKGGRKAAEPLTVEDLFDTSDFPEFTDVSVVKSLGGSTGAQLVKDKTGNEFVMKSGASEGHVREEFMANCLYKLLGVNVPTMKLYEHKAGGATILSKYMPNTVPANNIMDEQLGIYLERIICQIRFLLII